MSIQQYAPANGFWIDSVPACDIGCNVGFVSNGSSCAQCDKLPLEASRTTACNWSCNSGFVLNGSSCIPCANSTAGDKPLNAVWLPSNAGACGNSNVSCMCNYVCPNGTLYSNCKSCAVWATETNAFLPHLATWLTPSFRALYSEGCKPFCADYTYNTYISRIGQCCEKTIPLLSEYYILNSTCQWRCVANHFFNLPLGRCCNNSVVLPPNATWAVARWTNTNNLSLSSPHALFPNLT